MIAMIFVTVGTHEQPFDRLVQYIDGLKRDGVIRESVILQTGYSVYEPRYCEWEKFFPYPVMQTRIQKARIIVTHGGPSSFIPALQIGKIPVVVPRQKKFGEHVNDHQVKFCRAAARRNANLIVVEEIGDLKRVLLEYDSIAANMSANLSSCNQKFNERFRAVVSELIPEENSARAERKGVFH